MNELIDRFETATKIAAASKRGLTQIPTMDAHALLFMLKENGKEVPALHEYAEIVRCKNCEHCYTEGFVHERNVCEIHPEIQNPADDWFCADGRKRDEQ